MKYMRPFTFQKHFQPITPDFENSGCYSVKISDIHNYSKHKNHINALF